MRRGFWKELDEVFDRASAGMGAGNPAEIDENRADLEKFRKEVKGVIKRGQKLENNVTHADGRKGRQVTS